MDFQELEMGDNQQLDLADVDDIFNDFGQPQEIAQVSKSDAVMFIIDCNMNLLKPFQNQSKAEIEKIFDGYSSMCKSKVISSPNDKIGLMLYNVKNTNNHLKFNGINVVHAFDSASAQRIKQSEKFIINFEEKYGLSQKKVPLYQVLWLYNNQLKSIDKKKFHLRLFLFTNEENPHQIGENERDQAINHAKQLSGQGVQIQLFPMRKSPNALFDIRKFFIEIVTLDPEQINEAIVDSSDKIMDLQQRLRQKQFKKRTLNRLLMKIGDETQIGIKIFSTFNKAKKPLPKKLDAKTNKPLKRVAKVLAQNGDILHETDIGNFYPIGGEKIPLKKDDLKKMKSLQAPGLTLIGFKPKKRIKVYHNFRTSYFLYPDEERVTGSSQFVDALIKQMSDKQLVALVKLCARQGSQLRFCALFPQKQEYDQNHFQTPPGLNLIFLPYSDDIVKHAGNKTEVTPVQISNQLVHLTKLFINSLTFTDFDFRNFQNPSLQKFYANLQAHALGEAQVQQPEDLLKQDEEAMLKYEDITQMIKDALRLEIQGTINTKKNVKAECYSSDEQKYQKPEKRTKTKKPVIKEQIDQEKQQDEVQTKIRTGDMGSLKVNELKAYLKSKGLQQTGKKQELIDRILIYLSK